MNTRNVVYLITSLRVGGAQKSLLNLLEAGLHQQDKVTVIALFSGDRGQDQCLDEAFLKVSDKVVLLGINRPGNILPGLWRLGRLCYRLRPQLLHGWMHHGNVMASLLAMILPSKPAVFWSMHHTPSYKQSGMHHRCLLKLGKWLSTLPQHIFFVSKRSLQRHQELGYCIRQAVVLPNGIPVQMNQITQQLMEPSQSTARLKALLNIPENHFVIGSLTRFVEEKDIPNLLKAAHLLCQQRDDVHFLLAGEGMDERNDELARSIDEQQLASRVHLMGVQKQVAPLIQAMDVATLSSKREALPLFLAEAMAQGVPCVATDVGDVAVLLEEVGLVVATDDPDALQQAWLTVLTLPADKHLSLLQKGQQRISQHYSMNAVVGQYQTYLYEVLPAQLA